MKKLIGKYWPILVNLALFGFFGYYIINNGVKYFFNYWYFGKVEFVEVAFFLHNLIFLTVILARKQHKAVDKKYFDQAVALMAFCSGMFFSEIEIKTLEFVLAANIVTWIAIVLGVASMLSLGRSFGILIAVREVKTGGIYRVVRHPMYLSDIVWRIGMILKNPSPVYLGLFVGSSACYVYRALLEEKFLVQRPEYKEYMGKVTYRFIPGIF